MESTASTIAISYATIRDLALFQEQYDRLSHEMQQVRVQLESSPALPTDAPRAAQREEWRSWLQLQIKSKGKERDALVEAIRAKGIEVQDLPD